MKLLNTNGREYTIEPIKYITYNNDVAGKSKGHLLARKLIKDIYPSDWVLEEVPAKVGKTTLYLDFLIKSRSIVVEVQGIQHYVLTPIFHATEEDFNKAKARDYIKEDWCEINGFTLIKLNYGEEDDWRKRLCE